jgi:acetyl-CoA acetyltransferase
LSAGHVSPDVRAAIAGIGLTEMGRVYGRTDADFAAEALAAAVADAGLAKSDIDGLLISPTSQPGMTPWLHMTLGLRDLNLLSHMNSGYGATAVAMLEYASMAISQRLASVVAIVHADARLQPGVSAGASYANTSTQYVGGMGSLGNAYGLYGATVEYAMAAQRHMALYGTTSEQLAEIAVAQRAWAVMNPAAQMRTPITVADHQNSRLIAEPFHLFDCALSSNGAVAVIVTSAERARELRQPPVYLCGFGQGYPGDNKLGDRDLHTATGATVSGERAMKSAGITPADVDICELYDCYTYTVLVTLEDYGFCAKGDGGAFVADGRLGPGGSLPTNTGGGQLSAFNMWAFTPLHEGVLQSRGHAGDRQAAKHDVVLVSANGGYLNYHGTVVLSPRLAP